MNKRMLLLWLTLREFKRLELPKTYKGANVWLKVVFLLQAMGLPYGYFFRWYVYGPHSVLFTDHMLTCSYFSGDHMFGGCKLSERKLSADILEKIKRITDELKSSNEGVTLDQQILFTANCLYLVTYEELAIEQAIERTQNSHSNWLFDGEKVKAFLESFPQAIKSLATA